MKLSIIVPIYNVEPYIGECLDSLLSQGLDDMEYEIICVDDGSTDRSGQIAEAYAEKYSKIIVIHQENRGVSAARNAGIEAASGEYLYFIDPDDYIKPDILGKLYNIAVQNDLEKLMFDYLPFEDGTEPECSEEDIKLEEPLLFSDSISMGESRLTPEWKIVWNYLIKSSVIQQYNLRYLEIPLHEDAEFNFWLDHCVGVCGYIPQKLYFYRRHKTCALGTYKDDEHFPKYISGRIDLAAHYKKLLEDFRSGKPPKLLIPVTDRTLETKMIDELQGIINNLIFRGDRKLLEQSLKRMKEEKLYPYPLRWNRLFRRSRATLKNRLIDLAAFLLPSEKYLRLCMWARCILGSAIRFNA